MSTCSHSVFDPSTHGRQPDCPPSSPFPPSQALLQADCLLAPPPPPGDCCKPESCPCPPRPCCKLVTLPPPLSLWVRPQACAASTPGHSLTVPPSLSHCTVLCATLLTCAGSGPEGARSANAEQGAERSAGSAVDAGHLDMGSLRAPSSTAPQPSAHSASAAAPRRTTLEPPQAPPVRVGYCWPLQ